MAAKTDPVAAKQAKQKKILIVGSVLLVAVLAIQLPKLLGGGGSENTAATATTDPAQSTAPAESGSTGTATPVDLAATGDVQRTKAGVTQLASFSLFETKDPFIPKIVVVEPATPGRTTATAKGGATSSPKPGSGGSTGGTAGPKPAAVGPTFATISVNGTAQALTVKQTFPADDPLFVLVALKPKTAKIGIAGGKLDDGKTAGLALGKKLTLVNDATGARYTLELLYIGTEPEQVEGFTSSTEPASEATGGDPTATTTP